MIELKSARTPTNGDKIRDMSDEELAAWICLPDCTAERYETCFTITAEKRFDVPYDQQTEPLQNVLDWLHQPAPISRPHENGTSARGHENIGEGKT